MERYPDNRAGVFVRQEGGYDAFIPHPLPPPDLVFDEGILYLLSKADGALARLDGVTQVLPNPDLFVAMYIKKEALLSSQIEGTQASLQGVLEFEAHIRPKDDINEIQEVFVYAHSFLTRVYKERLIRFCPPMTKLLLIRIAVRRKSRGVFHDECQNDTRVL